MNNKNGAILPSYLLDFDNFGTKWYLRFKFYQCVWFLGRWRVDGTLMASQTSLCESLNLKMIQKMLFQPDFREEFIFRTYGVV